MTSRPNRSPSRIGACRSTRAARARYGHRHKEQEEVYFVASGKLQFKLDDDIVELERGAAVRVAPETWRSVWNEEPDDAELIIVSKVVPGGSADDAEYLENFWPE